LKDENKTQSKLGKCVHKEPLVNKETMTNPIEVGISSNIEVQTLGNLDISTNKNVIINKETQVSKEDILPNVKQEDIANMVRKDHVTRKLYHHPNHNSHCNQRKN
jgi:hypothetical protein